MATLVPCSSLRMAMGVEASTPDSSVWYSSHLPWNSSSLRSTIVNLGVVVLVGLGVVVVEAEKVYLEDLKGNYRV